MIPPQGTANMQAIAGPGSAPQASPTGGPLPPDLMKLVSMLGGNPNGKPPGLPAGAPGMMQASMPAGAPAAPAAPATGMPGQAELDAMNKRLETELAGQNKSDTALANERLALSKKFGIGTYATEAQAMAKERQRRQDELAKGRGYQDAMAQLAAYATPGARWSDVVKTDLRNKASHMEQDRAFQDAQDKYLDSVNKMLEEQRVGNLTSVEKDKDQQNKARVELLKQISHNLGVSMQTAERYLAAKLAADTKAADAALRQQHASEMSELRLQTLQHNIERDKNALAEKQRQWDEGPERIERQKQIDILEKQLATYNTPAQQSILNSKGSLGEQMRATKLELETKLKALRKGGSGGISDLPTEPPAASNQKTIPFNSIIKPK